MLGSAQIQGKQVDNVYFGAYQQSKIGTAQPTEGVEGVDWVKAYD